MQVLTNPATAPSSVASAAVAEALPPAVLMMSTVSSPASRRRSITRTLAPSSAYIPAGVLLALRPTRFRVNRRQGQEGFSRPADACLPATLRVSSWLLPRASMRASIEPPQLAHNLVLVSGRAAEDGTTF